MPVSPPTLADMVPPDYDDVPPKDRLLIDWLSEVVLFAYPAPPEEMLLAESAIDILNVFVLFRSVKP